MPQVTVYIRKDDLPLWEAIEKKSEWLSSHLNSVNISGTLKDTPKVINKPEQVLDTIKEVVPDAFTKPTTGVCKIHGIAFDSNGKCLQKGCKQRAILR